MSAWIDPLGVQGGPIISNEHTTPYGWKSYPEALTDGRRELEGLPGSRQLRLQRARVLQLVPDRPGELAAVPERAPHPTRTASSSTTRCNDRLPTVSWIIPTSYQSEHPTTPRRPARTSWPARSTRSRPTPTCGTTPSSSSTTTRTTACSTTCRRPPRRPAPPASSPTSVARPADRRRLPGAVPHRLAVDGGRLDRQRDLRPHLRAAVPRAADRGDDPEHHPWRRQTFGDLSSAFGVHRRAGSPGCRTPRQRSPRPSTRSTTCPPRWSRPPTRSCRRRQPAARPVRARDSAVDERRRPTDMSSPFQRYQPSRRSSRARPRRACSSSARRSPRSALTGTHRSAPPPRTPRASGNSEGAPHWTISKQVSRPAAARRRRQEGRRARPPAAHATGTWPRPAATRSPRSTSPTDTIIGDVQRRHRRGHRRHAGRLDPLHRADRPVQRHRDQHDDRRADDDRGRRLPAGRRGLARRRAGLRDGHRRRHRPRRVEPGRRHQHRDQHRDQRHHRGHRPAPGGVQPGRQPRLRHHLDGVYVINTATVAGGPGDRATPTTRRASPSQPDGSTLYVTNPDAGTLWQSTPPPAASPA